MLKFLNIANFAIIHKLSLELNLGLNLLTGETGAGKSIIVDALGLLLGGRAAGVLVRTGERAAVVEGLFELSDESERQISARLAQVGIDKSEGEDLVIRREVQAGGRSRIFINDKLVTAGTLRSIQPFLIDIHGQGEQQALTWPRAHLELLDEFAGCVALRREVEKGYARWKNALEARQSLEGDDAARERASDMLKFQLDEIERAAIHVGEDVSLASEKSLLANAERLIELSSGAYNDLYERDESALSLAASVRRRLSELGVIDVRAVPLLESLETATTLLVDVAERLRSYGAEIDFTPGRLAEVENRLAEIERLKRKYSRDDVQGLQEVRAELERQLSVLSNVVEREQELLAELNAAVETYIPLAERLTAARREAAKLLEVRVVGELRHVALERARFVVGVDTATSFKFGAGDSGHAQAAASEPNAVAPNAVASGGGFFSPWGADRVEFQFSANMGESLRPLASVASGGELSRLMLALRTVCRGVEALDGDEGSTLVFDEIDVGIGGRVAEAVGRRLKALAATRQVLCVTHQPQIARFADYHYAVTKYEEGGRTVTGVKKLDREERVGELARMIGGADIVTTARETARWMLDDTAANQPAQESADGVAKIGNKRKRSKGVASRRFK